MKIRLLALITLFALSFKLCRAEESLLFKQISTQDGLSQNTVRTILCDHRGFIWAGTLDGLNRYDGKNFLIYKPQPGNPSSLSDNRIKEIFEDRDGYLWIKKYNNTFSCYNPQLENFIEAKRNDMNVLLNYTFYHEARDGAIWLWGNWNGCIRLHKEQDGSIASDFHAPASSQLLTSSSVRLIFEDSQGNIWAGCQSGLNRIAPDLHIEQYYGEGSRYTFIKAFEIDKAIYFVTTQHTIFIYDLRKQAFLPDSIHFNKRGIFTNAAQLDLSRLLFLCKEEGLITYDIRTKQFDKITFPDSSEIKGNVQFTTDRKNGIWIYNHSGVIWYYNPVTENVKRLTLIPPDIASVIDFERYNIYIDSRDSYWITTYGNGLFNYDPETEELHNYRYTNNTNSPASDYLLSIAEDKSGNLWIGSEYGGIIKAIRQDYQIKFIRPEPEEHSVGKSNNVKVVFEDSRKNVWVGTKNGSLYLYDRNLQNNRLIQQSVNPYTIMEDDKQRIWVGTKGNGISIFNLDGERETIRFASGSNSTGNLSHKTVFHLMQDTRKRIWISTFGGGLNVLEETGDTWRIKRLFRGEGNRSRFRYTMQDRSGQIWAGSYEGLLRFDPDSILQNPDAYTEYRFNINDPDGLSSDDIKTIFQDEAGAIWIGTAGGGLNRYQNKKGREYFIKYTSQQGLAGDIISSILEGYNNNLWIGSESGLTRLDRKRQSLMAFHFAEQFYGNNFNENAACLRDDGELLWGTLNGIMAFNPRRILRNRYAPQVTLTDFFINDQRIGTGTESPLKKSIGSSESITLSHQQNTFTIQFATLNLTEPDRNRYSYMLENYENRWSRAGNINSVTYQKIPPGTYTFKVRGSNADGRWNPEDTHLEIIIRPPFWKSDFAYFIYAVFIAGLLYIAFRLIYKFNNLHNAVKIEKQLTDYKLRFFTNISHEFRTPLTLIRGAVENLDNQAELPDKAKKQIKMLSRNSQQLNQLIDQLLEFRKIQNNILTLNLEETDIIQFAREIYAAFLESAAQKQIAYRFTHKIEKLTLYIDRGKVDKILFNLLSNAFKFTPAGGSIELHICRGNSESTCLISVRDTGIGIPKEKQHLLFSRFMQVNFSSIGTGVGLSLVKEFTEVHKGHAWYEPNGKQGSVFNIELPVSTEIYQGENFISQETAKPSGQPVPSPEHIEDELPQTGRPNWKVLIIDDNQDIRDFLKDELSSYFETDTADNGKTGLEKAIETNPDLIICDVMMPKMDGFEVTRRLKDDFQTSHIPVILLTALSSQEHQLEGIENGADSYIMKPFSMKYLLSRVNKLIEQREKLKQRFSNHLSEEKILSNSDKDKEFYELLNKILDDNIAKPEFSVDSFTELAGLRRTLFYKKVKGLTGYSPNELIKIRRMKKAAGLLASGKYTVSEASWQVGIEDPFYFSKCFKAQFGCSPSKYGK